MKLLTALVVVLDLAAAISGAPGLIYPAIGASIGLIMFGPLGS